MKIQLLLIASFLLNTIHLFSQTRAERIDKLIKHCASIEVFSGNVLVIENGKILYAGSVGESDRATKIPNNTDTKFRIGSITKSFTAVLIMQLIKEKKIKLNDPIIKYIPEYPEDKGGAIKIKHLLWHQSGIPNFTDLSVYKKIKSENLSFYELSLHFRDLDLEFKPGSKYKYSNSGYEMLGYIIEKATGKKFETVLNEKILHPLKMNNTGMCTEHNLNNDKHANGYEKGKYIYEYIDAEFEDLSNSASGGIYSTVEDLYKFSQIYNSDILLPKKYSKKLYKQYWLGHCYGCFVYKEKESNQKLLNINHSGRVEGFKCLLETYVYDSLVIVILSNIGKGDIYNIADQIRHIVYNNPYKLPKTPISLAILKEIKKNGIDKAINKYFLLKRDSSEYYSFSETELSLLGYKLMNSGEIDCGIKIFNLNINEFPKSHNVYGNLGDALLIKGDTLKAIETYLKSMKIRKVNQDVINKLEYIGYKVENNVQNGITVPIEIMTEYVGIYSLNPNIEMKITLKNDSLFAQRSNWSNVKLYALSELKFSDASGDAEIIFNKNKRGKIKSLTLKMNENESVFNKKSK